MTDEVASPPKASPKVNWVSLLSDGRTIHQTGYCTLEHIGNQLVPEGGHLLVVASPPNAKLQEYDVASQTFVPRLAGLQDSQIAQLRMACTATITGGFSSSALGEPRSYPSGASDQSNMARAALVGAELWCALGDVWSMQPHTVDQAKTVLADFGAFCDGQRDQLATVTAQVNSATTPEAISASDLAAAAFPQPQRSFENV